MRLVHIIIAVGVLLVALVPLALPFLEFVLTIAIAKGFAALGVALLLRAGMISIGHAMFYAVGAYTAAFLGTKLGVTDLAAMLLLALLMSALTGLILGAFLVRYRAIFFAMLNLAISMVVFALASKFYGITGGSDGLRVPIPTIFGWAPDKPVFDTVLFYVALTLAVSIGYLVYRYLKSPLGHALASIHTNEVRLEYLGVSAWAVLLAAYVISASLAGIGGAIAAVSIGHVLPEYAFWTESGHFVLTAVLGGIGGVVGPFIGSIFLESVHSVAVNYAAEYWNMIMGAALLIVIFFLPRGLYGLIERRKPNGEDKL
ncbi:branched-chain amino acid ABC transporter permease [Roseovarius sp. Pro17]|uniref:branched-chain amino acid ABC transporter permease n=1 Tax=Roseovarius sp. Pro17 TaxID=3108175 RepID=UPI002D7929EF|nr:branched-chain amino acid ABC transporter permease [Roseovarius sp. Pro17]